MKPKSITGVALGLVLAAITLTAPPAFAGNGTGAAFNLGTTNTVNASTALQGTTNGPQLRVANSSTGPIAGGIVLLTDLRRPPLTVTSQAKVANLNFDLLDGVDSNTLQRRVTGQSANGTAIQQVNTDGSVVCTTTAVFPIHVDIPANRSVANAFTPAGMTLRTDCHIGTAPAGFTFRAGDDSGGLLNWMFSRGGDASTVDANGAVTSAGGEVPVPAVTTNRIEGQFTWAEAHATVTLTLHFLDLSGRCELDGTAEVGAF